MWRGASKPRRLPDDGHSHPAPRPPARGLQAAGCLTALNQEVVVCARCPRLVDWRQRVAREKRAAFTDQKYWGRPVPSFGDPDARVLIVGLAPAAHGANRTGRMFTGDRSGDWLYRALHRAGFANQSESHRADDGLTLRGAYVTAAVRCAPPGNRPTPRERDLCRPYLERELDVLTQSEGDRDPRSVCLRSGPAGSRIARAFRPASPPQVRPRSGDTRRRYDPTGILPP